MKDVQGISDSTANLGHASRTRGQVFFVFTLLVLSYLLFSPLAYARISPARNSQPVPQSRLSLAFALHDQPKAHPVFSVGLIYRHRYYEPSLGRFTSPDPIGYSGGLNLYNYSGSDPVNAWDPMGLARWEHVNTLANSKFSGEDLRVWQVINQFVSNGQITATRCSGVSAEVYKSGGGINIAFSPDDTNEAVIDQIVDSGLFDAVKYKLTGVKPPPRTSNWVRFTGALQTLVGVGETLAGAVATGLGGASEGATLGASTPVSVPAMIGGTILIVHGIDNQATGLSKVWNGTPQRTITSTQLDFITGDEQTSETIDAIIPLAMGIPPAKRAAEMALMKRFAPLLHEQQSAIAVMNSLNQERLLITTATHYTNSAGKEGIDASRTIIGNYGVWAVEGSGSQSRVVRVLTTLVRPSRTTQSVNGINASGLISPPVRGPMSLMQRWMGVLRTPGPGLYNIDTGVFRAGMTMDKTSGVVRAMTAKELFVGGIGHDMFLEGAGYFAVSVPIVGYYRDPFAQWLYGVEETEENR